MQLVPTSGGSTGEAFDVTCSTGYTLNPGNDEMICVDNVWQNIPTCDGTVSNSGATAPSIHFISMLMKTPKHYIVNVQDGA